MTSAIDQWAKVAQARLRQPSCCDRPLSGLRRPRQQEQTQKAAREAAKKKKHQVFFSFADRSLLCLLTRCFSELFSPCFFQSPFRFPVRFWFQPLTEELFSFD